MSRRVLIVNADDCNLTPGVTRAILACHDTGILTSTTFMINLPVMRAALREVKARPRLGVGLHLNVTFQKPVSRPQDVRSLVEKNGNFRHVSKQTSKLPAFADLAREYEAQVLRFRELFGRFPTHLDTHHQLHDHPLFLKAVLQTARKFGLPARRSRLLLQSGGPALYQKAGVSTNDYFFGNLTPEGYWRRPALTGILENLPAGISEIMCHPGLNDAHLKSVSSFTAGRQAEYELLRSPGLRKLAKDSDIELSHYGRCYPRKKS